VNDILGQLRSEWIHLAFLAIYAGGAYLISRSLRLRDERVAKVEEARDIRMAKVETQIKEMVLDLASHARQIRDTRAATACCETELKIQHYPYTD
jgi:hypothetical protein